MGLRRAYGRRPEVNVIYRPQQSRMLYAFQCCIPRPQAWRGEESAKLLRQESALRFSL